MERMHIVRKAPPCSKGSPTLTRRGIACFITKLATQQPRAKRPLPWLAVLQTQVCKLSRSGQRCVQYCRVGG